MRFSSRDSFNSFLRKRDSRRSGSEGITSKAHESMDILKIEAEVQCSRRNKELSGMTSNVKTRISPEENLGSIQRNEKVWRRRVDFLSRA
jgi:hypothetical protein